MSRRKPYVFAPPAMGAPIYWRSREDLSGLSDVSPRSSLRTTDSREELTAEFPGGVAEFSDPVSRRSFMTLMGAATAMATLEGCRRPVDNIMPYTRMPEGITLGNPNWYATVIDRAGDAVGLLVESHEGRPTKVEGNPDHPGSLGATDMAAQASVLDLYDPDRQKRVYERASGERGSLPAGRTWAQFDEALRAAMEGHTGSGGAGFFVLSQPTISPTLIRLRRELKARMPQMSWHTWSAVSQSASREGTRAAFGVPMNPVISYGTSRVIVSIDADFLQTETGMVRNTRGFAAGRKLHSASDTMTRLYVVESSFTTTGSNADHRLRLKARSIEPYLKALAGRLVTAHNVDLGPLGTALRSATAPEGVSAKWIEKVALDLANHRGESVLVAGARQPATVHALVAALNVGLGNSGSTVRYTPVADADEADNATSLRELLGAMEGGQVRTLLILGGNPVYDAPGEASFGAKLDALHQAMTIRVSTHIDETSQKCRWLVPESHYLEAWGDAQGIEGSVAIQQPLIAPLYGTHSAIEILSGILYSGRKSGHELVRDTATGSRPAGAAFEREWRSGLNRGVLRDAASSAGAPGVQFPAIAAILNVGTSTGPAGEGLELTFNTDPKLVDGRYGNNPWLLELPDPMTRITWDNAAVFSERTAREKSIESGDMVRLSVGGRSAELVAWVMPGQVDGSVAVYLGWGRTHAGQVGNGKGFDVNPLRALGGLDFAGGVELTRLGSRYPLSQTQDHHRMEGRPIAIEATYEEYQDRPNFAQARSPTPRTLPLWREVSYEQGHKWGMSIDLNACTGCNACVIACQAENNIPNVGKDQVSRGREMHWLRVDRYFVSPRGQGDSDALATSDPSVAYQPLACVHCEEAPCENVCPVTATTHSPEGLNEMAYNRCIGTRYCANNCPYKVRRFNYLNWHNDGVYQPGASDVPESVKMQQNPQVTVRFRGVMEKCTYCVQRIQNKKIEAKREDNRPLGANEIVSACQQACPAGAIVFGDLNERASEVARLAREDRRYALLAELGTQPRTSYLAKVRNPNPEMLG